MLSAVLLNTWCSRTVISIWRSPEGPPPCPGPTIPFNLTLEPVSAPAGIFTLMDSGRTIFPRPAQALHAFVIFFPEPPQAVQYWDILKKPLEVWILPVPLQVSHC